MDVTLWVVQIALAAFFGAGGVVKAVRPRKRLYESGLTWVEDFSDGAVTAIGVLEVLAALGLVLPAVTGIAPILTPIAAACLALVMVLAAAVHVRRREPSGVVVNAVLFVLAAFVAWGRFGPYGW